MLVHMSNVIITLFWYIQCFEWEKDVSFVHILCLVQSAVFDGSGHCIPRVGIWVLTPSIILNKKLLLMHSHKSHDHDYQWTYLVMTWLPYQRLKGNMNIKLWHSIYELWQKVQYHNFVNKFSYNQKIVGGIINLKNSPITMQIMLLCTKYSANYKKSNVHQTIKLTYYTKIACCFLSWKPLTQG